MIILLFFVDLIFFSVLSFYVRLKYYFCAQNKKMELKKDFGFWAIVPLLVFVIIFLGGGLYFNNFYVLPSPLIALVGVVVAMLMFRAPLRDKINTFLKGCGEPSVLTMCIIYLLAGGFATVSKEIGSVDSIVNFGLSHIHPNYFPIVIFVLASFLSFASGTSVGSITALGPIVVDLALQSDTNLGLVGACLLSGAMFGDNLSLISDTTIAATQSMQCAMNEKIKANFRIALPAAILTLIILFIFGKTTTSQVFEVVHRPYEWILMTPYLLVVVLSLFGLNVFVTLFVGILYAGLLGLWFGKFDILALLNTTYEGFTSMSEIFFLSLFLGGLAALVEHFGGIRFLMNKIQRLIRSERSASFGIAALVSTVNTCVANNTVSILITGKISKKIADKYHIAPRNGASILDIFSCYVQGLVPYGAQVLALIKFSDDQMQYSDLFKYAFYLHLLLISTVVYIITIKNDNVVKNGA